MRIWLLTLAAAAAFAQATLPFRLGSTGVESVRDLAVDQRGNIVVGCTFERTVDFDPAAPEKLLTANGGIDACVAKYDAAGNYLWAVSYGGPGDEEIVSVATDPQGNIYVAGTFTAAVNFDPARPGGLTRTSRGGRDIYFLKLTPEGRVLWELDFGSTADDQIYHLRVDSSGGIYITGYFQRTINFGTGGGVANFTSNGGNDLYLARFDTNGNYLRAITLGANDDERGYAVGVDGTGVVWLFGSFVSRVVDFAPDSGGRLVVSQGGSDFFLSRFTPELSHLSTFGFGGIQDDTPAPGGLFIDFQNNVYLTGSFRGSANLHPGGVFVRTSAGEADAFFIKLDARGVFQQAASFGGTGNDTGLRVMADLAGAIYVAGSYTAQANFDQGPGRILLTGTGRSGATDGFVVRYNAGNSVGWTLNAGGNPSAGLDSNAAVTGLIPDGRGFLLLGGRYFGRMQFGPAPGVEIPNEGAADLFVARVDAEGRLVRDLTQVQQIAAVTANANFQITPLTGGSVHTIFGNALTASTEAFSAVPLSTRLCGVEVRITDAGGREWLSPLYFCSPNQINFIAPRGMAEGRAILNLVSAAGRLTTAVEVARVSPAIFVIDAQGTGAIVFGAGPFPGRVVSEAAPSRPGDLILVYLGGLGPVTPEIADGVLVQALHSTLTPARVRVQNQEAQVLFSGLAPGNPGLYQLNVIVPSGLAPGTYPLTVTIENRTSPAVPLVVR